MENITDADYAHGKQVCKDFEIKDFGEYHDLYFQSETLLLAKENKAIKYRIMENIGNLFEHEEEDYYKQERVGKDDNDEECVMHSISDNIEIMMNDEAGEVIEELFKSLKNR